MEIREALGLPDGSLIATSKDWKIQFDFAGPDRRYRYTLLSLGFHEVDTLIKEYPAAFERYEKLKQELPTSTKANETFSANLTIRVNDFAEGVCLSNYRSPVKTRRELDLYVETLRKAQLRGAELMRAAASLGR